METLEAAQEQLEGIPGFDYVIDFYNDKVGGKFQTKDPFHVQVNGKSQRRKLPDSFSKESKKTWKKIQKKAWLDDNNFFGCYPINIGCGLAPILTLIPVIGPLLMYAIHARMITIANETFTLPLKLVTKLQANIGIDLIICFIPLIGTFFAWLNACSTRNAALIHTFIVEVELNKLNELKPQNPQNIQTQDLNYGRPAPTQ